MTITQYKIRYAYSARDDVAGIKEYILLNFKYCQLVENFKKKMQKIEKGLNSFPDGYEPSGFIYRGYTIYMKPESTYLVFYVVDKPSKTVFILRVLQDGMNWKYIIDRKNIFRLGLIKI
ncbi:MAG: type II toxin-antitoxin system RelE/ParE family toxin [Lachnospira sp.]|nr:type II toxin-antitoxin system RelE/ParE family toxin [Lachnospira sp.]